MPRLLETMESLSAAEASLFLRGSPVGRRSAAPAAVIAPENCPETEQLARDILIGEGGFSLIWLAITPESERFALKQMHKARVARRVDAVLREKAAFESLPRHPCLVRFYGTFQDDASVYLVLEVCATDLYELVQEHGGRDGRLPESWARIYSASVALALRHLHAHGWVYRDLKLENVLVDRAGHAKLADLGAARPLHDGPRGGGEGGGGEGAAAPRRPPPALGTAETTPPEMIRGAPLDFAYDWWGCAAADPLTPMEPQDQQVRASAPEAGTEPAARSRCGCLPGWACSPTNCSWGRRPSWGPPPPTPWRRSCAMPSAASRRARRCAETC